MMFYAEWNDVGRHAPERIRLHLLVFAKTMRAMKLAGA